MTHVLRTAAWLLLATITVLSLVPAQDRPVTPAPHAVEHLGIFILTGLAFGFGYKPHFVVQAIGLVSFCAAIEIAQLGVPGRHARFSDFVVDVFGVLAGLAISAMAVWIKESISLHSPNK